jgi:hypothetical protein
MAMTAVDLLSNAPALAKARAEFTAKRAPRSAAQPPANR